MISLFKSNSNEEKDKNYAEARRALDQLAHDIRNPLARLRGWAEIALSDESDREAWKMAVEAAFENSEVILKLLDLESEQLRFRHRKFEKEKIDVNAALKEILAHQHVAIDDKSIVLKTEIEPGLVVEAEKKSLIQALNHLIDNAVKYNVEKGEITVAAHSVPGKSGKVEFVVTDTGEGILPAEIGTVFKRLFRGNDARKYEGYGIGLTYAREFALSHDGEISVVSPPSASSRGTQVRMIV